MDMWRADKKFALFWTVQLLHAGDKILVMDNLHDVQCMLTDISIVVGIAWRAGRNTHMTLRGFSSLPILQH